MGLARLVVSADDRSEAPGPDHYRPREDERAAVHSGSALDREKALATYPNPEDLRREYPELEAEDIRQALEYGAAAIEDRTGAEDGGGMKGVARSFYMLRGVAG